MQWLIFFVLFLLLQENVFIYLDVTDYLKILDFFSQRCSVLFSFVITMKWLTSVMIIIIVMA